MPRRCTICAHGDRPAIDQALVAGRSYRTIVDQYGVSKSALIRHRQEHLPAYLQQSHDARLADDLLCQVRALQARTHRLLDRAETAGDLRAAIAAIREARANLELLNKLHETDRLEARLERLEAELERNEGIR